METSAVKQQLTEQENRWIKQAKALVEGEPNLNANLANLSAFLNQCLNDVNWVGFYYIDEVAEKEELVLGPFQGLPACLRLPMDAGVCSASVRENRVVRVDDVHAFPGHIACDSASQSEICVPLWRGNQLIGVLDIDSPIHARFTSEDERFLQMFVDEIGQMLL